MDDLSKQSIRGYELQEQIGTGGFGAVYRAYQPLIKREVAIKVILPEYANHPDFIRNFEYEAQLVARLEHPHIVPLYDYWREPDSAYLVMRWLRGGSLIAAIKHSLWGTDSIALMLDQIAAALHIAHRNQFIHRDIKPDNILLDEDRNAYLADFGIAKELHNEDEEDVIVGTPAYIAPEQIQGRPLTPRTDIYSLGILLYEVLVGAKPYSVESPSEFIYKHLYEPLPIAHEHRRDIPAALSAVLQKATAKNPEERYPTTIALALAFRGALNSTAPAAQVETQEARQTPHSDEFPTTHLHIAVPAYDNQPTTLLHVMSGDHERTTHVHDLLTPEGVQPTTREMRVVDNPYKGLRAFQEADAADFFGRVALIDRLIVRLGETGASGRFLAVVGASGSGKSSAVKAGLIPALRAGRLPGSSRWFMVEMFPGAQPFAELERALLRVAVKPIADLEQQLRGEPENLARVIKAVLPDDGTELLLLIDQFEELFTLVDSETERGLFIDSLTAALRDESCPLRVVITLRADFYDRPLLYSRLAEIIQAHTEVVIPLNTTELEQAVVRPAERVGLTVDPGLVMRIVTDVAEQPGTLPLLQYALTELFENQQLNELTLQSYLDSGGVLGALARRADELFDALDETAQVFARQLFLRLVTLNDNGEQTRRRVGRVELAGLAADDDTLLDRVVDLYGRYRLLTFDRDPATRAPTVEVAHEALLRTWDRLYAWIEDSREDLLIHRRLAGAVKEWNETGRDASFLASGARLAQFEVWSQETTLALNADEIAYVQASAVARQGQEALEEARRAHELALQKRAAQRLRLLVLVLLIATLVASGLTGLAVNRSQAEQAARATSDAERDRANLNARLSRSRELAVQSITSLEGHQIDQALLLSLAARTQADTFESRSSLFAALQNQPALVRFYQADTPVRSVTFSPDGALLAAASASGTLDVWDAVSGALVKRVQQNTYANTIRFSPDGQMLAAGGEDGAVWLWDTRTFAVLDGSPLLHADEVWSLAFNPDGTQLAVGGEDGLITRWDAKTRARIGVPLAGHTDIVFAVTYSPDGARIASTGADQTIRLWDAQTGEPIGAPLTGHENWIFSLAYSPDGARLASAGADQTIRLWDAQTREPVGTPLTGHADWIRSVVFNGDGRVLASASIDQTVRLWTLTGEDEIASTILTAHSDAVWSAAFAGDLLAAGGADGRVTLWDVRQQQPLAHVLPAHQSAVQSIAADGARFASASVDGVLRLWDGDANLSDEISTGVGDTASTALAYDDDERGVLALGGVDGRVTLWRMGGDDMAVLLPQVHHNVVFATSMSTDGALLASGDDDGVIALWNAANGKPIGKPLHGHTGGVRALAFSPDKMLLASGGEDNTVRLWEVSGAPIDDPLVGHTDRVLSLTFSPDGTLLASGGRDGVLNLWDVRTRQIQRTLNIEGDELFALAFSPGGNLLAIGGRSGAVLLLDVSAGQLLANPLGVQGNWVMSLAFSGDARLLSGGRDGSLMLWDVDAASWAARACQIANRSFTDAEQARFFNREPLPQICP